VFFVASLWALFVPRSKVKRFACSFKDDGNSSANYGPIGCAVQVGQSNHPMLLMLKDKGGERLGKSFWEKKQVGIREVNENESLMK
jgi:hypothetical protein